MLTLLCKVDRSLRTSVHARRGAALETKQPVDGRDGGRGRAGVDTNVRDGPQTPLRER